MLDRAAFVYMEVNFVIPGRERANPESQRHFSGGDD
jgi:hypothetical protein